MSATTSERRETKGFVAETLRRPIQEAVREGVEEALREERADVRQREGGPSGGGGGRSWGRLLLLGLIGVGAAYAVMRRRRSDSGGGRGPTTSEIREGSKTTTSGQPDVGGEGVGTMEEGTGASEEEEAAEGATPGAGSEDD